MKEIVKNFLLAVDKFMPEMHLRQPGFKPSFNGFEPSLLNHL